MIHNIYFHNFFYKIFLNEKKMNFETIEKYIKKSFLSDGIKKEDIYTDSYIVKDFNNEI